MADKKLIEAVSKYIDKYYIPEKDDIKMDSEMISIFDKITKLREKKKRDYEILKEDSLDYANVALDENAILEFDESSMTKTKITKTMAQSIPTKRNIDDLVNQVEETFSERLLRMIDERGLKDSEVYNKARIDRRHFAKIRKNVKYSPNKKTVKAFAIALELSMDETKDLLNCAGYALSRSSKMDIIVAYFLKNKIYDMFEINEVLCEYEQPTFE